MSTDRVEVPQTDCAPVRGRPAEVGEDLLDLKLGAPVRVGGFSRRVGFMQRKAFRRSVDRGGGAEDESPDARLLHGLKKPDRADQIVVVILKRLHHGFADGLQAGEMDDGFNAFVAKGPFKAFFVTDVALNEFRGLSGDCRNAFGDAQVGIREVVVEHRFVACFLKHHSRVGADKAHAACQKYAHTIILLSILGKS